VATSGSLKVSEGGRFLHGIYQVIKQILYLSFPYPALTLQINDLSQASQTNWCVSFDAAQML
jgi:hypothetical protein